MIVEVISSLPIALAIDVAIVSVIFCAIACVIHCLCVIVWLIENKYRVRSPLLEQLYWTMCYTSLAQLRHKQRQRHLSEHIQFLRRAVFKSSSLKPGDSTSWTDGEGRETTTWVSQRLQICLKNYLRNRSEICSHVIWPLIWRSHVFAFICKKIQCCTVSCLRFSTWEPHLKGPCIFLKICKC